jgi:hypothetical protein
VFSTTLSEVQGNARLATGSLTDEIERLRAEPGDGDIAIGGATLAAAAAELDLIDEYRARFYPMLVGGGIPFFPHTSAGSISSSSTPEPSARRSSTSAIACCASRLPLILAGRTSTRDRAPRDRDPSAPAVGHSARRDRPRGVRRRRLPHLRPGRGGLRFTNHTDRTVTVTAIDATGHELAEPIIHALKPGEAIVANDRFLVSACTDAYTLVALDEHGAEIARRAGRICAPGDWVIEPTP